MAGMTGWSLEVNVANEQPFAPGEYIYVESGVYLGIITGVELVAKKEKPGHTETDENKKHNLRFTIQHDPNDPAYKAEYRNKKHNVYLPNPGQLGLQRGQPGYEDASMTRRKMRTVLESMGVDPAQLDSGNAVRLNAETFVNRQVKFWVDSPPAGERDATGQLKYANVDFITPKMYAERKAQMSGQSGAAGVGGGASFGGAPAGLNLGGSIPPPAMAGGLGGFAPQTQQPMGGALGALVPGGGGGAAASANGLGLKLS